MIINKLLFINQKFLYGKLFVLMPIIVGPHLELNCKVILKEFLARRNNLITLQLIFSIQHLSNRINEWLNLLRLNIYPKVGLGVN